MRLDCAYTKPLHTSKKKKNRTVKKLADKKMSSSSNRQIKNELIKLLKFSFMANKWEKGFKIIRLIKKKSLFQSANKK
jgi:hypothetical protein